MGGHAAHQAFPRLRVGCNETQQAVANQRRMCKVGLGVGLPSFYKIRSSLDAGRRASLGRGTPHFPILNSVLGAVVFATTPPDNSARASGRWGSGGFDIFARVEKGPSGSRCGRCTPR